MAVIRAFENENPFSAALVHSVNTGILRDRGGVGSVQPAESHQCDLPYPHDITQEMESWAQHESPACRSSLKERTEREVEKVTGGFFKVALSLNNGNVFNVFGKALAEKESCGTAQIVSESQGGN